MNYHSKCPLCESVDAREVVECKYLLKCSKCFIIFDKRIPSANELFDYYKIYSYTSRKNIPEATKISFSNILDSFEKFRHTNNIFDIGCGQGDFLVEAKKRGWNVYGSEYSSYALDICNNLGIKCFHTSLQNELLGKIEFDVATSFEVIEHILEPNELFAFAKKILRTGGIFYATTPNYNSLLRIIERENFQIISYPEHLLFFTKESLFFLAKKIFIDDVKIISTGIDLARLKNGIFKSKKQTSNTCNSNIILGASIEDIRSLSYNKNIIYLKSILNRLLSMFMIGDTLKIFYIKK